MGNKGISVRNDTPFDLFVGLSTGAYVYWGIVEPGNWFERDTGKVWMSVSCKVWTFRDFPEPTNIKDVTLKMLKYDYNKFNNDVGDAAL